MRSNSEHGGPADVEQAATSRIDDRSPAVIRQPRPRFWAEAASATVTAVLAVVSSIWRDWLEIFGVDLDHGNGSLEWSIVTVLAVLSLALACTAGWEWRRRLPAT